MPENDPICLDKIRLMDKVQSILAKLVELGQTEQDAFKREDHDRMEEIDRNIEQTIGEKERAIGAYKQHVAEHGC
jgi:fructose-1,6-bisphosphatase/inositol monophosphatase family enzyme